MSLKKRAVFLWLIFSWAALNALPVFSLADPSVLAPEAQEAFQKGMVAAEQGAMDLALKYFHETQKSSPFYPPVLFNLGVALAKSGKELPAIAWLHAYLVSGAAPEEKKTVEGELLKLEVAVEAKAGDVLKQAAQLADLLPQGQYDQKDAYRRIYGSYAAIGDLEEAEKFRSRVGVSAADYSHTFNYNLSGLAEQLVEIGDVAKAEEVALKITEEDSGSKAWLKIAIYSAAKKDFAMVEALRPKIKNDQLAGLVKPLIEDGQKDLALDFAMLANAEAMGGAAVLFLEAGYEAEAKALIAKAVELLNPDDPNAIDTMAAASIKAHDFDTLRKLILKLEEYTRASLSAPWFWTARLAGFYSQLKEYKKADALFATIPPDDPNDWAGKNKSTAANEILKAAVAQGDFERFQNYIPHNKVTAFWPAELGEMFAGLVWDKLAAGKEPEAQKIMAACPDGGSLEAWKVDDPNFHREAMYRSLALKAAQADRLTQSYEFAGKVFAPYWRGVVFSGIFDVLVKKEALAEAQALFEKEGESLRQGKDTIFTYRNMLLGLVELQMKKNEQQAAQEKFNEAYKVTIEQNDFYSLDRLIELAEKLHLAERVQELKHLKTVNAWVTLAAKLENDTTFNPEQIYQDAKAKAPGEAPGALAMLAENYWARLREINFLKKNQQGSTERS